MNSRFRDIDFPKSYRYSSDSDHIPLEFYEETFPISKTIDLLLGYFSTNAIKVLSKSFAEFILNGGKMRIITNHIYNLSDFKNLYDNTQLSEEDKVIDIFKDLNELEKALSGSSQHFFDCLKYLLKEKRLELLPVKFNEIDLAHCKRMILYDGSEYITTEGSINFTLPALIKNAESFQVETPWNGNVSQERIKEEINLFNKIFSKEHLNYEYLEKDKIEVVINSLGRDKEIRDLLDDSLQLSKNNYGEKVQKLIERKQTRFEEKLEVINNTPQFPFSDGPRDYQKTAYKKWVQKNYSGVFAMATGTGKTITSLNCLLNIYNKEKSYRAIILVPSISLLNQWEDEVLAFRFKQILKVGGGNNWEKEFANYCSNLSWGLKNDLIVIATYGSFILNRFQNLFKKVQDEFILIADEAHNMGANNIKTVMRTLNISRKIGLSATPKRIYDPLGTLAIDEFFEDEPPYTYSYSMERALEKGNLTGYKYFPKIVELTDSEFEEYAAITKQLLKYFDFEKGHFKDDPVVEFLLLKRKRIIHKAYNKLSLFKEIIRELIKKEKCQYVFGYIPEGYYTDTNNEEIKIIDDYLKSIHSDFPHLKMNSYTSSDQNLNDILRGFEEGKIEILLAMKMLDEGVDVPRAEVGIFASSTGNPRQFIQRRGRLLRNHPDKVFSTIYDMIVIPNFNSHTEEFYTVERNLVKNELIRVAYFSRLSLNFYDSKDSLESICNRYNLDLDTLIQELE